MNAETAPGHAFLAVRARLDPRAVAGIVVAAAVIVVISAAIAWDGTVPRWEAEPLRWIVSWPDWLEPGLWLLQQAGVLFAPVVAGLVVVWFTGRWRHLLPFVLVVPLKLGIERAVIKQFVERERPHVSLGPEIEVRGAQLAGLSFPSGHVTTATALAVLLVAFLPPRYRPIPLVWAGAVGLARLYFGEHNVLDVVAGAALGAALAAVLWSAFLNPEAPAGAVP